MKSKFFDMSDLIAAVGIFLLVFCFQLLWAYPYPHPELWSQFAVAARMKLGDASSCGIWLFPARIGFAVFGAKTAMLLLALLGKAALGGVAVMVYFSIRELWICYRPTPDTAAEFYHFPFFYSKMLPLVAACLFAFSPFAWRTFQFFSADALVISCAIGALTCWVFGRNGQRVTLYSFAFLISGGVAASHPVGLGLAFAMVFVDSFERWRARLIAGRTRRSKTMQAGDESDEIDERGFLLQQKEVKTERFVFSISFLTGFFLALYAVIRVGSASGAAGSTFSSTVSWWVSSELGAFKAMTSTMGGRCALLFPVLVGVATKIAWQMHLDDRHTTGYWEKRFFTGVLGLLIAVFICRDVDQPSRQRLAALRDYADVVAEGLDGVRWFFTDGRLDDSYRLALADRNRDTTILSVMSVPSRAELDHLKEVAPEPGDREIFERGGCEIFNAWARERGDRLKESAWQMGGRLITIHGKVKFGTFGSLMRDVDALEAIGKERVAEAEKRMRELSQRLAGIAAVRYSGSDLFGSVDKLTASKFDSLMWRAARMASERYTRYTAENRINIAQQERELAARLDELNRTLKLQGDFIERMLPTERLILTPKEALDVALKRADFQLARKYANQVLVSFPEEQSAHFALAMASMQEQDYTVAARHFEVVRLLRPNEPAMLNNLALCYMKMKRYSEALECAEKAAELQPSIERIQNNLREMRKRVENITSHEREAEQD